MRYLFDVIRTAPLVPTVTAAFTALMMPLPKFANAPSLAPNTKGTSRFNFNFSLNKGRTLRFHSVQQEIIQKDVAH
jgi:hypothetical protein